LSKPFKLAFDISLVVNGFFVGHVPKPPPLDPCKEGETNQSLYQNNIHMYIFSCGRMELNENNGNNSLKEHASQVSQIKVSYIVWLTELCFHLEMSSTFKHLNGLANYKRSWYYMRPKVISDS